VFFNWNTLLVLYFWSQLDMTSASQPIFSPFGPLVSRHRNINLN
jgi:hypothetical protein